MKKLLILGCGIGTGDIIQLCKKNGIYTIVTDPYSVERSDVKRYSDSYWNIDTSDIESLAKKCREENIDGVLSGGSDFNTEMCILLCEKLKMPFFVSSKTWHYSRDKADFKNACRKINARVPFDYKITEKFSEDDFAKIKYPVIVKPVDGAGNKGVSYCYNQDDVKKAYKYAKSVSSNPNIIVEQMIKGKEWYASYIMKGGDIRLLALCSMFAQPGEPKNCYTITTTVSNHIEHFINTINPKIIQVLKSIGCNDGYCWVQVMLDEDGQFYIIEMGYRLDGDKMYIPCKDIRNYDTLELLINISLGIEDDRPLPESQIAAFKSCGTGMMLWTHKDGICKAIVGAENIAKIPGIVLELPIKVGDAIPKYKSIGVITFTTEDCEGMCRMIDNINKTLKVINDRGEDVIIKYTDFDHLKQVYYEGLEGR